MKPRCVIWLASWLITIPLFSQFSDDFSDGNLVGWQGDTSHFTVNGDQQLQLTAPSGSDLSWIYVPVSLLDSMSWEIYFKLNFAPSTSNQLRVYLGLTDPVITSASGYFLEIGASGDQDPVELKYLDQGSSLSIASSVPGLAGTEPVELHLRITKNSHGLWQCFHLGNVVPELLFSTVHDLVPLSSLAFYGIQCTYTDTRRDKFFFDNIQVAPMVADMEAPDWISVEVLDQMRIRLEFDEALDGSSVTGNMNYVIQPGGQHPVTVSLNQNQIQLGFATPFVSQQEYTLHVEGIRDLAGNEITPGEKTFIYLEVTRAGPNELLITEIMADPSPVIGLPDAEYLELYNASSHIFRLSDYIIRIGTSERTLPDSLIFGGEYVILCREENKSWFAHFGRTLALASMPALTNSGTLLVIEDEEGNVLHEVDYTTSWYQDPQKSDGGWSLEMRNPTHICSDQGNWTAADNLTGGTPGTVNTHWSLTPDQEGPEFISLFTPSPETIHLRFDEKLDPVLTEDPGAYTLLPDMTILSVMLWDPRTIEIKLSAPLQPGIIYTVLPFDVYDCLGNKTSIPDTTRFGLVTAASPGDLLVNEILFNPATGGSRFIEIINRSSKFISLGEVAIARISSTQQDIYPTGVNEIIGPEEMVAFTPDPADILSRYVVPEPLKLFEADLPSWDDMADHVALVAGGQILDSLTYSASWHHPVIADQNGVSLERISAGAPSTEASTWHSAAAASGFGTPTGPNSQNLVPGSLPEAPYSVSHSNFSPNGDGYKDFLALNFQLSSGNYLGSVWVYDLEGREIYQLASNESLGTSAILQWDGRDNEGNLADMGIYVILIQLWNADGQVQEFKETCALVKR